MNYSCPPTPLPNKPRCSQDYPRAGACWRAAAAPHSQGSEPLYHRWRPAFKNTDTSALTTVWGKTTVGRETWTITETTVVYNHYITVRAVQRSAVRPWTSSPSVIHHLSWTTEPYYIIPLPSAGLGAEPPAPTLSVRSLTDSSEAEANFVLGLKPLTSSSQGRRPSANESSDELNAPRLLGQVCEER